MPQVDNLVFLEGSNSLFKDAKLQGSVYLSQKRLVKDGPDAVLHSTSAPYALVFRASNGKTRATKKVTSKATKRQSFSTIVDAADLPEFWKNYVECLKKGACGLRKKEKKKAKKN